MPRRRLNIKSGEMTKQEYRDARALIEDSRRWTVGSLSDDHGRLSALGACYRTLHADTCGRTSALHQAAKELFGTSVVNVNNYGGKPVGMAPRRLLRNHARVLQMFDRAIELADE